jgi:prepilin-type N-terminal cleavage/methylation domain-containing protein
MKGAKLPAFSLLEILVALVIIGVVMTFPNWLNLSNKLAKSRFAAQEKLQLEILLELTRQATSPTQSVVRVDLPMNCIGEPIKIGAGGAVEPAKVLCGSNLYFVSRSGQVYE